MNADRPSKTRNKTKTKKPRATGLIVLVEVLEDHDAAMDAIRYIVYDCIAHSTRDTETPCKPTPLDCTDARARTTRSG